MDEELRERYLEAVRQGKGEVSCARAVGATVRAMRAYIAADFEFGLAVEEAQAEAIEIVANKAWERAQAGDWAVAEKLLQTRKPEDWLPVRDQNLRLMLDDSDIDINELHQRLAAQSVRGELPSGEDTEP